MKADSPSLVAVVSLREFFHDSLRDALRHQKVSVADQTEQYVVNLLTEFSDSDRLFELTSRGKRLRPLALMLTEALEAPTPTAQDALLQRMADVSLFVAGFFSRGFERKLVDIDYHISMGSNAYSSLSERATGCARRQVFKVVFSELAHNFQRLVDALNDVSELSYQHTEKDVLRLYEIWVKTGSPRAYEILKRLGVAPISTSRAAQ